MMFTTPSAKLYTAFFAASMLLGNWYPRIADVQNRLDLDGASLGQSLAGLPLGIMLAFTFGARLVSRFSFIRVFAFGTPVLGLGLLLAGAAPSAPWLFAGLVVAGLVQGVLGIAGNVEADRMETALGRPVLVRGHGFWSLATLAGGFMASAFRSAAVAPAVHLAVVLPLALVLLWFGLRGFVPSPVRSDEARDAPPLLAWPTASILWLFLAGGLVMFLDGAASDWSVILMRDAVGAGAFLAGLGFTSWALGQAVGRLFFAPVAARMQPLHMALGLCLTAVAGLLLVVFATGPWLVIAGFALVGLGTSAIFPTAISAAARLGERSPAANVASLSQLAFVVSVLSPLIMGWAVEAAGIRVAFAIGLAVLAICAATIVLRRPFG